MFMAEHFKDMQVPVLPDILGEENDGKENVDPNLIPKDSAE